jgi:hypothetical protein
MGQILHASATTTEAVRRAIQHSQESLALATRYGVNPKTVLKWRKRSFVADLPTGPREAKILGPVSRRGGDHRRVPAPYPPAARRLSLRLAGNRSPSDAVVPASLLATTRHQPAPGGRRGKDREEEVQVLCDRLLSQTTSPKSGPKKASSICSSASTGPRNSPSCSCMSRPIAPRLSLSSKR